MPAQVFRRQHSESTHTVRRYETSNKGQRNGRGPVVTGLGKLPRLWPRETPQKKGSPIRGHLRRWNSGSLPRRRPICVHSRFPTHRRKDGATRLGARGGCIGGRFAATEQEGIPVSARAKAVRRKVRQICSCRVFVLVSPFRKGENDKHNKQPWRPDRSAST